MGGLKGRQPGTQRRVLTLVDGNLLAPEHQRLKFTGGDATAVVPGREETAAMDLPTIPAEPSHGTNPAMIASKRTALGVGLPVRSQRR